MEATRGRRKAVESVSLAWLADGRWPNSGLACEMRCFALFVTWTFWDK